MILRQYLIMGFAEGKVVMNDNNEYQKILLHMLEEITSACEKINVPCFLVEGTCLGAIRHNGFIPWDDDIDIAIPADDFDRFMREVPGLLGENYRIHKAFIVDDWSRIFDINFDIKSNIFESDIHHPWVDLLILCGMPNNSFLRKFHYFKIWILLKIYKASDQKNIIRRKRGFFASFLVRIVEITKIGNLINTEKAVKRLKNTLFRYRYEDSDVILAFPSWYFEKEIMPKEVYGDGVMVPFETIKARVPQKFDEYLTQLYGDYKQLPPESERTGKHLITVIKSE